MPDLNETRAKAHERLPGYMVPAVLGYIERGEAVGGFLSALLSNDLRGTFERADGTNAALVDTYLRFLYNYAPAGCWGSIERFDAWQEKGGLEGRAKAAEAVEAQ
jgi:hypothetical protein